jgi:amino-acid N-acetyltransferase
MKEKNSEELDGNGGLHDLTTIREALRYARRYRGSTFVIQFDYPMIIDDLFPVLLQDIALLYRSGIRVVIIAGSEERTVKMLEAYSIAHPLHNGVPITSPEALPFVEMSAFDAASSVVTGLAGIGIEALIGNWVRAKSRGIIDGVDYQFTGSVEKIVADSIRHLLEEGYIPILPAVGWNPSGKSYRIAADELAYMTAAALTSEKLFYIGAHGILRPDREKLPKAIEAVSDGRISRLTVQEARELEVGEYLDDRWRRLIAFGRRACESGVSRVHILDGGMDGVILREIFSNLGVGTMLHTNKFESIRPMERRDVSEMLHIMEPYVKQGILLPRDAESIEKEQGDYVVYDLDGSVYGCAALHLYRDACGEIAAVAVDRNFSHMGIGRRLVDYLFERARESGLTRIFALTTQTSDWFESIGFKEGKLADIPEKKRSLYNHRRNSKILVYEL